jgi:putative phosphoesterase
LGSRLRRRLLRSRRSPHVRPELTLVAVISDTHLPRGGRSLPAECLRRLDEAELILHAGDFVSKDVLGQLRRLGPLEAVHGNMDDEPLRQALPRDRLLEVGETKIAMVHDAGPRLKRAERLAARFPGCDAIVYGHTHMPDASRLGATWILNPGSPTERRRAPAHSMMLLRIARRTIEPEVVFLPT